VMDGVMNTKKFIADTPTPLLIERMKI